MIRKLLFIICVVVVFGTGGSSAQTANESGGATGPVVSIDSAPDRKLDARLSGIFGSIEELRGVGVAVNSGVVTLHGAVNEEADREKAASIASRLEGVVEVRNEIEVNRDIGTRSRAVYERFEERLSDFIGALPLFLLAVIVFTVFVLLSRWLGSRKWATGGRTANPLLRQLLMQSVRTGIVLLGLVLALEVMDATSLIGAVLGAAGLTGLVLGFALKETVENYVAGLLMSLRQPFEPYDHIFVSGYEGHVIRLTSRATVIMTLDGNHVRIPNAEVFKNTLVNYSRNPERRFEFDVGVGVQTNLIEARQLAIETLGTMSAILRDPEPDCWVETLGDSNVVMKVLGWIDQREHSLPKVRGEAIRRVKIAFEAANYDLPEPIYRLNLMNPPSQGIAEPTAGRAAATNAPATAGAESPARAEPPDSPDDAKLDLEQDTHITDEIARERARMSETDLLDPAAQKE